MCNTCAQQVSETTSLEVGRLVLDSGAPGIRKQSPAWGEKRIRTERDRVKERQTDETLVRMTAGKRGKEREREREREREG